MDTCPKCIHGRPRRHHVSIDRALESDGRTDAVVIFHRPNAYPRHRQRSVRLAASRNASLRATAHAGDCTYIQRCGRFSMESALWLLSHGRPARFARSHRTALTSGAVENTTAHCRFACVARSRLLIGPRAYTSACCPPVICRRLEDSRSVQSALGSARLVMGGDFDYRQAISS